MKQENFIFIPENLTECNTIVCDYCKFYNYRVIAKNPLLCEKRLQFYEK